MNERKIISEIYNTIQGEGPYTGIPVTLVRFHGCNLKCHFCDTYTAPNLSLESGIRLMARKLHHNILLTGGEPLLYPEAIVKIVRQFPGRVYHLETNGTLLEKIQYFLHLGEKWVITISPKRGADLKFLRTLLAFKEVEVHMKYLVRSCEEEEISALLDEIEKLNYKMQNVVKHPRLSFSFSPINRWNWDLAKIVEAARKLARLLEETDLRGLDVRLNVQLHKILEVP